MSDVANDITTINNSVSSVSSLPSVPSITTKIPGVGVVPVIPLPTINDSPRSNISRPSPRIRIVPTSAHRPPSPAILSGPPPLKYPNIGPARPVTSPVSITRNSGIFNGKDASLNIPIDITGLATNNSTFKRAPLPAPATVAPTQTRVLTNSVPYTQTSVPVPAPIPIPAPAPQPVSVAAPAPAPIPAPGPEPVSVPAPVPTPAPRVTSQPQSPHKLNAQPIPTTTSSSINSIISAVNEQLTMATNINATAAPIINKDNIVPINERPSPPRDNTDIVMNGQTINRALIMPIALDTDSDSDSDDENDGGYKTFLPINAAMVARPPIANIPMTDVTTTNDDYTEPLIRPTLPITRVIMPPLSRAPLSPIKLQVPTNTDIITPTTTNTVAVTVPTPTVPTATVATAIQDGQSAKSARSGRDGRGASRGRGQIPSLSQPVLRQPPLRSNNGPSPSPSPSSSSSVQSPANTSSVSSVSTLSPANNTVTTAQSPNKREPTVRVAVESPQSPKLPPTQSSPVSQGTQTTQTTQSVRSPQPIQPSQPSQPSQPIQPSQPTQPIQPSQRQLATQPPAQNYFTPNAPTNIRVPQPINSTATTATTPVNNTQIRQPVPIPNATNTTNATTGTSQPVTAVNTDIREPGWDTPINAKAQQSQHPSIPAPITTLMTGPLAISSAANLPSPTVPNYSAMTLEQQVQHRANFRTRFGILRTAWPNYFIPDVPDTMPLEQVHAQYDVYIRHIHISSSVDKYKVYLVIMWLLIELFCTKIGLKIGGYTMSQMASMNKYEQLLIELGETKYKTDVASGRVSEQSDWPIEARIFFAALVNAVTFIIIKMVADYIGEGMADTIVNAMASYLTGTAPQPGQTLFGGPQAPIVPAAIAGAGPGPAPMPDALGGPGGILSGLNIPSLLANFGSSFIAGRGPTLPSMTAPAATAAPTAATNIPQATTPGGRFRPAYEE